MTAGAAGVRALRRFLATPAERCDFCRVRVPDAHAHLVAPETLRLFCACEDCADAMSGGELGYRRVAPRREPLAGFAFADADWARLQIPIDVAFLFRPEDGAEPAALFPGPAGATRSQLSGAVWRELARRYPLLAELEPGAEALLVNRAGGRRDHYRVSIDHCYALAGLMRRHWRGLAGGPEAWAALEAYFADLATAAPGCDPHREAAHA